MFHSSLFFFHKYSCYHETFMSSEVLVLVIPLTRRIFCFFIGLTIVACLAYTVSLVDLAFILIALHLILTDVF